MIAIPNMEKPQSCGECLSECINIVVDCVPNDEEEAKKNCPLIEIVQCKDCKHWNEETHGCNRNPSVEAWWESDFCSYGELRERITET